MHLPGPQAAENPGSFDAACLAKVTTAVIKLGYSDEGLLVPLLDSAVGKLPEFTPKAVVELVSGALLCRRLPAGDAGSEA